MLNTKKHKQASIEVRQQWAMSMMFEQMLRDSEETALAGKMMAMAGEPEEASEGHAVMMRELAKRLVNQVGPLASMVDCARLYKQECGEWPAWVRFLGKKQIPEERIEEMFSGIEENIKKCEQHLGVKGQQKPSKSGSLIAAAFDEDFEKRAMLELERIGAV